MTAQSKTVIKSYFETGDRPTQGQFGDLVDSYVDVSAFSANGIQARTSANEFAARTITGTAGEISISNGDGVAGNPTISIPTSIQFNGKNINNGTYVSAALTTPEITMPSFGSGPRIFGIYSAMISALDFGSISAQSSLAQEVKVSGAVVGNSVAIGGSVNSGIILTAAVVSADTLSVRAHNYTAAPIDPSPNNVRFTVISFQ